MVLIPEPKVHNPKTDKKVWYAIYTRSRTEKKVNQTLVGSGIETYLPLIKSLKQWSDRKKWVEEPLFKSYIFVHILPSEYLEVLNKPGVVRYITFQGKAVVVPDNQIEAIRMFINEDDKSLDSPVKYVKGEQVEIFRGQLKGIDGRLVEVKGKQKVVIEIETIGQHVLLTIPKSYLKKVK